MNKEGEGSPKKLTVQERNEESGKEANVHKYDVFLSYAKADEKLARTLAEKLRDQGLSAWVDEHEYNVKSGEDRRVDIKDAIDKSRLCLVLLSDQTLPLAPSLSKEWAAIQERTWQRPDLPVCPVILQKGVDVPPFLHQWNRLHLDNTIEGVDDAAKRIKEIVNIPNRRESSVRNLSKARKQRFSEISKTLQEVAKQ